MTSTELITHGKLNKRAVRRHRYTHSDKDVHTSENEIHNTPRPYRSAQSLSKALHRVKRALPRSPSKKAPVVKELATDFLNVKLQFKNPPQQHDNAI